MKKPATQSFNVDLFNLIIEISPYFYIHVRFMNRIVTNETWTALYFYYTQQGIMGWVHRGGSFSPKIESANPAQLS